MGVSLPELAKLQSLRAQSLKVHPCLTLNISLGDSQHHLSFDHSLERLIETYAIQSHDSLQGLKQKENSYRTEFQRAPNAKLGSFSGHITFSASMCDSTNTVISNWGNSASVSRVFTGFYYIAIID